MYIFHPPGACGNISGVRQAWVALVTCRWHVHSDQYLRGQVERVKAGAVIPEGSGGQGSRQGHTSQTSIFLVVHVLRW